MAERELYRRGWEEEETNDQESSGWDDGSGDAETFYRADGTDWEWEDVFAQLFIWTNTEEGRHVDGRDFSRREGKKREDLSEQASGVRHARGVVVSSLNGDGNVHVTREIEIAAKYGHRREDEVGEEFNFRVGVESGEGFKDWETWRVSKRFIGRGKKAGEYWHRNGGESRGFVFGRADERVGFVSSTERGESFARFGRSRKNGRVYHSSTSKFYL